MKKHIMLYHLLKNVRKKRDGSGLYEVREAAYHYEFDKEMLDKLDEFMRKDQHRRMGQWYEELSEKEKGKSGV